MSAGRELASPRRGEALLLAAALLVSLASLWFVTGQALVVAGFAGGLIALGGIAWVLGNRQPAAAEAEYALPDWSVTVAAIERPRRTAGLRQSAL
jgi:two-component system cell cycle sensor histidine kinase/response regulator CckA